MAPELFEGKPLDVRTDVFSVGVMLYQMATSALPFTGRNPHEVLKRIAEGRFPDPRTINRLVADRLTRIISRALAKKPDDRYPTIEALVNDLRAYVLDAGLENAREEIKHFVVDPEGYEEQLAKRIVCGLVATGRREQAAGKLARALECWNRALAIDPQNHDVLRALKKIEGRRRIYRGGVVIGGAALLGGLIWGAFKVAREDVPAPISAAMRPKPAKPALLPVPAPKPVADSKEATARVLDHNKGRKLPSRRDGEPTPPHPAIASAPTPEPKTFIVAPNPNRAEIWVDDKKQFDYGPEHTKISLSWDKTHTIKFVNDNCCEPFVTQIGPNSPSKFVVEGDRIIGLLPRKPAYLKIRVVPPIEGALIELRELGDGPKAMKPTPVKSGEQVAVPFDAKGELRKTMQISVYVGDKPVNKTDVEIVPGDKKDVPVSVVE
jgi:serine/threonine-protein kinase